MSSLFSAMNVYNMLVGKSTSFSHNFQLISPIGITYYTYIPYYNILTMLNRWDLRRLKKLGLNGPNTSCSIKISLYLSFLLLFI